MIKGLTHDVNGVINQTTKYKGKISTGFAPGEGPNKANHPIPCGYFRMLKEITINDRIGGKDVIRKEWKLNEDIQKKLEETLNNSKTPRKIDFICLFSHPEQLWESSLAMYSSTDGLMCRGHGMSTVAKQLKVEGDKRTWLDRECKYKECPDFMHKDCKEIGLMKVFPLIDISTNPYRFETRSLYTIAGIEASLDKLWNLCKAAHIIKKYEAKKDIPFEGFFGMQFSLIHKKTKGAGRDIFITDIIPTPETAAAIMEPIKRGIKMNQAAALTAGGSSFSLLNADIEEAVMIEGPEEGPAAAMDSEDEKAIASQFGADAAKTEPDDAASMDAAAATLLDK
jgi:hypothetical protein